YTGDTTMPDNEARDASEPHGGSSDRRPSGRGESGSGSRDRSPSGGNAPPSGKVLGSRKSQFVIANRRYHGVEPMGFAPLAFNVVENALRSSPDIEVVDTIGPKGFGALADGMSGTPNIIVARMSDEKAATLRLQGAGQ